MPKTKPKNGNAYIVIAYKTERGTRMEFDGQLPLHLAQLLMSQACSAGRSIEHPTEDAL
jgi:CYTH domain-containing protein